MGSKNPFAKSEIEHHTYLRFVWQDASDPELDVLRNKMGLRTNRELEQAERDLVGLRIQEGYPDDVTPLTYEGFRRLHFHLFQDLFDWAGDVRPYPTGRNAAPYCLPDHINANMVRLFSKLEEENFLTGLAAEEFARRAAHYVNELNAIHCFIDGNGRVGREWLCLIAENAGFEVEYGDEDRVRWNEAAEYGFNKVDEVKFVNLIRDRLSVRGESA